MPLLMKCQHRFLAANKRGVIKSGANRGLGRNEAGHHRTPTGLHLSAQSCEERATLSHAPQNQLPQPTRLTRKSLRVRRPLPVNVPHFPGSALPFGPESMPLGVKDLIHKLLCPERNSIGEIPYFAPQHFPLRELSFRIDDFLHSLVRHSFSPTLAIDPSIDFGPFSIHQRTILLQCRLNGHRGFYPRLHHRCQRRSRCPPPTHCLGISVPLVIKGESG